MKEALNQEIQPQSVLGVLEHVAGLREKVNSVLSLDNQTIDIPVANKLVEQLAQALIDLPQNLKELGERGIPVPDDVYSFSAGWSEIARQQLDRKNKFGMSVLLIPQGSTDDDLNAIEKLIATIEDPEREIVTRLTPTTKREDCVVMFRCKLTPKEKEIMGHNGAAKIVESMAYFGVFTPSPATFDEEAFRYTGGADLEEDQVDVVWNFLKRIGILNDESDKSPGRVSIAAHLVEMLHDTSNGFLTED